MGIKARVKNGCYIIKNGILLQKGKKDVSSEAPGTKKMVYFTVLRVKNFEPKSPEETPADGVILKAIPLTGVIPAIMLEFNHLVLKSGFMPHIWAVLYLSPKQPEIGEKANPEKFLTLKDVEELCKWGDPHKLER